MTPESMRGEAVAPDPGMVDPERVIKAADELAALAATIPEMPPPLFVGTGPMSAAIQAELSRLEAPIRTGLPALKAAALQTAAEIGAAGRAQRDLRREDPTLGSAPPAGTTPGATSNSDVDRQGRGL